MSQQNHPHQNTPGQNRQNQWQPPAGPQGAPSSPQPWGPQQWGSQQTPPQHTQTDPYGQGPLYPPNPQYAPHSQNQPPLDLQAQNQQAQNQQAQHQQAQYQRPPGQPAPGTGPLGRKRPDSVSIDQFREPRSRATWWIGGGVAVVVAGLLVAAFTVGRDPSAVPKPSPTASAPSSAKDSGPTAASSNGVPFHSERDDADGYWTITSQEWTSTGLQLTMELTITSGTMQYSFFALDNATTQDYDPADGSTQTLAQGTASEGEKVTGTVVFDKPKGDTTVYLAGSGRQVTALVVKG